MSMIRRCALTAAFALLTTSSFAQDTTALAQEYVNMPEVQNMITDMFSPQSMGAQVIANLPPGMIITNDQERQIGEVMSEAMNELRPRLEELMVTGSAEVFTAPELQALIDFYRSEHGAAIMSKMQPLMAQTMGQLAPEMQALQQRVAPEIIKIMQGE